MRYIFLLVIVVTFIILCIFIYNMLPDNVTDVVRETVGNATGYKKPFFPKGVMKELKFLQFRKIFPDAVQYIYYYNIETSNEKRVACVVTDCKSRVFLDKIEQTDFLYNSDTNKVYSIKLYPNDVIPPLIIQSESKPETFLGKVYTTNEISTDTEKENHKE